jgi:hypothetical protein
MQITNARDELTARIESDFTYHAVNQRSIECMQEIREQAKELAHLMVGYSPLGRELSTALTKLEEAVMHCNAGITRDPDNQKND